MAVLVTGGAGYIGSVTVERLLAWREEVVVLDNLSTGHRGALHRDAQFIQGSVHDASVVRDAFRRHEIDTVFHFAGSTVASESVRNPKKFFNNNLGATLVLLDAAIDAGVPRFIFSSTAAVYGHPSRLPVTEDQPVKPINPYGKTKSMAEEVLEIYREPHKLQYVILRYFNAAGATIDHGEARAPKSHLIPNVLDAAEGISDGMDVYGSDYETPDGTCIRDFVHVADLANAHLRSMSYLREGGPSTIINVGSERGNSVLEVIDAVKRVTGLDFEVRMKARRPGDAANLVASSARARDLLGWNPERGELDTIVRDAWKWRQAHPHGYEQDAETLTGFMKR